MAEANNTHRVDKRERDKAQDTPRFTRQDLVGIAIAALGFFMGRVVVFGTVNPVAAAYASAFFGHNSFFAAVLFAAAGLLTRAAMPFSIKYFITLAIMAAISILFRTLGLRRPHKSLFPPILAGASALASGLLITALGSANPYLLLMSVLEGVLAFAVGLIMQKGVAALSGNVRRGSLSNEELISLAILAGGVAAGAADVFIGVLSLRYLLCSLLILLMAQSGGTAVGATVGLLLGVLMNVAGFEGLAFPVVLGIGGLAAGGLRDVSKPFAALGFLLAGGILCLYFAPGLLSMELLVSAVIGALVFCFLPNRFMANIFETVNPQSSSATAYMSKMRLLATHRLLGFSHALKRLSATFGGLTDKKSNLDKKEINSLIDDVAAEVCLDCPRHSVCWEAQFYETYHITLSLLNTCETEGVAATSHAPSDFRSLCVAPERFCNAINHFFALYKSSLSWHNKLIESRALVSEQLGGVAHIMGSLAADLDIELDFKTDLERKIINACNLHKIQTESVLVLQNKAGKYEVTIERINTDERRTKQLAILAGHILGRKMTIADDTRMPAQETSRLLLIEARPFSIAFAVAKTAKTSTRESGDSHSFVELPDGHCLIALSDGMGSGRRARLESTAAIELLEEFLESGFDADTAVSMINSALLLKSGDELFSTLDICSIDLHDGAAEFIKIGASTTFLLRDGAVDIIRSWTLPVGVMQSVETDTTRRRLQHGDMLVMVTDGVLDSDLRGREKESWIVQTLTNFPARNPQDMADHLLACASDNYGGVIKDDMTVLVAGIWEKAV